MNNPEEKQPYCARIHRFVVPSQLCDIDVYITCKLPVTVEVASNLLTQSLEELLQNEEGQSNE